jgi:hypothetical protein
MWGLALRIVKWSLFIVLFAVAADPRMHGMPDPSYICIHGTCYQVVKSHDGEPEQNQPEQHYRDTQSGPAPHDESA